MVFFTLTCYSRTSVQVGVRSTGCSNYKYAINVENYKLTSKSDENTHTIVLSRLESPIKTQTARAVCLCEPAPCGLVGPDHAPVPFVSV